MGGSGSDWAGSDWAEQAARARSAVAAYALPEGLADMAAAYGLQDGFVAATGQPVGGFKLAANSPAQMAHFGVEEPASARILARDIHHSGVTLPRGGFDAVTIEPELAAILGPSVATIDAPVDRAAALAAIDRFHPAFELIDLRGIVLPKIRLAQAVALNVFNAGCVLGAQSLAPEALDLAALHVALSIDGETVAETTGTAPQDPVEAVMWLMNQSRARGVALEPGMVVMCGTHLPLRTLDPGARDIRCAMSGLGEVRFALSD